MSETAAGTSDEQSSTRRRNVSFFSSGYLLDAELHLPDDEGAAAPYPTIVACSGYGGLKIIHPERFARALTPRGYAVLAFDYRGFGLSEGERGRLVPQEWVIDVREATTRVGLEDDVDEERIALLGWALGGGVVVSAAASDPRAGAVVCVNGIGDGLRAVRAMHDEDSFQQLLDRIDDDRGHRVRRGRSQMTSPWDVVPLGQDTDVSTYVGEQLYRAHGFGSRVTLESADFLLGFRPEITAGEIAPRPLLIVHSSENRLHDPAEAHELYDRARQPKRLEMLEGHGHTEWMFDDHPTFRHLVAMIDDFIAEALA